MEWAFLVIRDKDMLNRMADANGDAAIHLRNAALGILVCGDLSRAFPPAKDYWVIDAAIAAQNMVLSAWGLGIGSVWLGTWPQMTRVEKQQALFALPEHIIPHSILAFGHPQETGRKPEMLRDADFQPVHFDKW